MSNCVCKLISLVNGRKTKWSVILILTLFGCALINLLRTHTDINTPRDHGTLPRPSAGTPINHDIQSAGFERKVNDNPTESPPANTTLPGLLKNQVKDKNEAQVTKLSYFKIPEEEVKPIILENYSKKISNNDIQLLQAHLPPVLSQYRNPCWYEPITLPYNYKNNYFVKRGCPHQSELEDFTFIKNVYDERCKKSLNKSGCFRLRCFPYFFLLGPCKTGTSDLAMQMNILSSVIAGGRKESQYWPRRRHGVEICNVGARMEAKLTNHTASYAEYLDLFDAASERIRNVAIQNNGTVFHPIIFGDRTPANGYLQYNWQTWPGNINQSEPKVILAHLLYHIHPHTKFIFGVREPVSRIYSNYHYWGIKEPMERYFGNLIKNFNRCLEEHPIRYCVYDPDPNPNMLVIGIYYIFIKDWLDVYPRDQLYVFIFEDYIKQRSVVINEIADFLGVDRLTEGNIQNLNRQKVANKGSHSGVDKVTKMLQDFYRPWNNKLAEYLNLDRLKWDY